MIELAPSWHGQSVSKRATSLGPSLQHKKPFYLFLEDTITETRKIKKLKKGLFLTLTHKHFLPLQLQAFTERKAILTTVEKWWMTAMEMQASKHPLRNGTDSASQTKAWNCLSLQMSTRFWLRSHPICDREKKYNI